MRYVCLLIACLGGCLEPRARCDDGRICAAGQVCVESGGCALPEQVAACDGLVDGDACTVVGGAGRCAGGICVISPCGNEQIDDGEVCDDGNTVSGDGCRRDCLRIEVCGDEVIDDGEGCDDGNLDAGDGCGALCQIEACGNDVLDPLEVCDDGNNTAGDDCSPDCRSDETCPNGRIDPVRGELCDDGDLASHDGCDTACRLELPAWRQRQLGPPPARANAAMVYDAARGRVVRFGGVGDDLQPRNDTWEWTGTAWVDVTPTTGSPPASSSPAMAYDLARRRAVLFTAGLTWEWDGAAWRNVTPTTPSPPDRAGAAMAFDAARARVVLFGGLGPSLVLLADTWEWDGQAWLDVTPAGASPPARRDHGLAYDPSRGVVVLFGGAIPDPSDPPNGLMGSDDTWEWNGAAWSPIVPETGPPPSRREAALVHDPVRARVVLLSGDTGLGDTWEWDGASWIEDTVGAPGPSRTGHAIAYDAGRGRIVVFGGDDTEPELLADTWERVGIDWTPIPAASTGPRWVRTATFDTVRGLLVTHGGELAGETWAWDGAAWRDLTPSTGPRPGHLGVKMAYDAARDQVVLVELPSTTWIFEDGAWTDVSATAGALPPRSSFGLVYDEANARVVLFGGWSGAVLLGDTWTWDGSTWIDATPGAGSPAPRTNPALGYDPVRERVILFGGNGSDGVPQHLSDTHEWDGATWTPRGAAIAPLPRSSGQLAFDRARGRLVLFGGDASDGVVSFASFGDTWEWDGAAWAEVSTATGPSPRVATMVYDAVRGATTLVGGIACNELGCEDQPETWTFRFERAGAVDESCPYGADADDDGATGCDDPDCAGACATCGDGVCGPLDTCQLCPADCAGCP